MLDKKQLHVVVGVQPAKGPLKEYDSLRLKKYWRVGDEFYVSLEGRTSERSWLTFR